jgi:membrane-bound lytic murein transglycosylase MltF
MLKSPTIQLEVARAEVAEALKVEEEVVLEAVAASEIKNVVAIKVEVLQDQIVLLDLPVQTDLIQEEEVQEMVVPGMEASLLVGLLSQKTRKVKEETDLCNHIF